MIEIKKPSRYRRRVASSVTNKGQRIMDSLQTGVLEGLVVGSFFLLFFALAELGLRFAKSPADDER